MSVRTIVCVATVALVCVGGGATAATNPRMVTPTAEPSLVGTWTGSYTTVIHDPACSGPGCLPGTPGYCDRTDPACQTANPPRGTCPDLRLSGTATMHLVQTSARTIRGTIVEAGGTYLHAGFECTFDGRNDWRFSFTGTLAGNKATIRTRGGEGTFTFTGSRMTGALAWTGSTVSSVTGSLHLKRA